MSDLIIPCKTNFELFDYFLLFQQSDFKYHQTGINSTLEINFFEKPGPLLLCFQVKKDFAVVYKEYKEITAKWELFKKTMNEEEGMKKSQTSEIWKTNFFLILLCDTKCVDTGKQETLFKLNGMDDILFLFADTLNSHFFYGK